MEEAGSKREAFRRQNLGHGALGVLHLLERRSPSFAFRSTSPWDHVPNDDTEVRTAILGRNSPIKAQL